MRFSHPDPGAAGPFATVNVMSDRPPGPRWRSDAMSSPAVVHLDSQNTWLLRSSRYPNDSSLFTSFFEESLQTLKCHAQGANRAREAPGQGFTTQRKASLAASRRERRVTRPSG